MFSTKAFKKYNKNFKSLNKIITKKSPICFYTTETITEAQKEDRAVKKIIELTRSKLQENKGYKESDLVEALSGSNFDRILANNPKILSAVNEFKSIVSIHNTEENLYKLKNFQTAKPVRVAVTGAGGAIGYSLVFRIASGELFGPHQPVILHLIDLPSQVSALKGLVMELEDCAFPSLHGIVATGDLNEGFKDVDYAMLVGAKPRGPGMERADLLRENGAIFKDQGKAINDNSSRNVKVVVVGNPANTNAWVASQFAPDLSPTQFSALTKLDHNRGLAQIANKKGCRVTDISRFAIWGNHSKTQYPDISHTLVKGKWVQDLINDKEWKEKNFMPTVQDRGAAIITARGKSSAASAGNAALQHIREWALGTSGEWTSFAVWSDGSYGTEPGIFFSFPVVCEYGGYQIVQNVPIDPFSAQHLQKTNDELVQERNQVAQLVGIKREQWEDTYKRWKTNFEKNGSLPGLYPPQSDQPTISNDLVQKVKFRLLL
eukprot:TRINITY_DN20_c1_g1_i1.p1 TRINITY_DN20_c1_g1~~TRINITY_DN20_c1_g1_i1.p1  ORF type:complete len:490 (+),score=181.67 TRINITY_DN20_c1_g1_i1:73-1542(+)